MTTDVAMELKTTDVAQHGNLLPRDLGLGRLFVVVDGKVDIHAGDNGGTTTDKGSLR